MLKSTETAEEIAKRVETATLKEIHAEADVMANPAVDPTLDYLLPTSEVARLLGCNLNFVKELIDAKMLVSLKFGRIYRIRKVSLNSFLEEFDGQNLVELVQLKKIARQEAG